MIDDEPPIFEPNSKKNKGSCARAIKQYKDKILTRCEKSGKATYETVKAAAHQANHVFRHFNRPTTYYKCPHCKGYHLTTIREERKWTMK